jgi:hypothetical protein
MDAAAAPPPPLRPGRPEAAERVWQAARLGPVRPDPSAARRRGLGRGVIGLVAAGLFLGLGHRGLAAVVGAITLVSAGLAVVSPLGAYAALERALGRFGALVGTALSWLLLAPMLYLVFFPFGFLFRRGAHDALRRAREPGVPSYWTVRASERPSDRARPF